MPTYRCFAAFAAPFTLDAESPLEAAKATAKWYYGPDVDVDNAVEAPTSRMNDARGVHEFHFPGSKWAVVREVPRLNFPT